MDLGEFLADGAGRGIAGLVAPITSRFLGDGALAFQHLHHHRTGGHELDQALEEGALAMHAVKGFSIGGGELDAARGDDPQARILNLAMILPVRLRRVASGLMMERVRSVAMITSKKSISRRSALSLGASAVRV